MSSTLDLVAVLRAAFPNQTIERETVRIYVEELSDLPPDILEAGIRHLLRTNEGFFPSIAAIRRASAEVVLRLPSEDEALSQVEQRIAWGKGKQGPPPTVHGDVGRALNHIGGYYTFKTAAEPSIVRSQFLKTYREIRQSRIRAIQIDGTHLQLGAT